MPSFPASTRALAKVDASKFAKSLSSEELLRAGNRFRKYTPKNQLNL